MIQGQTAIIPGSPNWGSYVVEGATRSPITHMATAVSETWCASLEPGGVRLRRISDYPDAIWSQFKLRPWQRRAIVRTALEHVGTKYAWDHYLLLGFFCITRLRIPKWVARRLQDTRRMVCSEFANLCLLSAGIKIQFDTKPVGAVTPASFEAFFKSQGWV